jgi:hypothetical protein
MPIFIWPDSTVCLRFDIVLVHVIGLRELTTGTGDINIESFIFMILEEILSVVQIDLYPIQNLYQDTLKSLISGFTTIS